MLLKMRQVSVGLLEWTNWLKKKTRVELLLLANYAPCRKKRVSLKPSLSGKRGGLPPPTTTALIDMFVVFKSICALPATIPSGLRALPTLTRRGRRGTSGRF